ncbi:unnamed protein product [Lactuca saligna]|uniref:FH2 domain-containing protein n=1 Tax=Lactuca saligna TaxID=75948 RepID=A0AA35YW23_LACSI|nr:unnamed protein product [Lactuca saligna]
MEIITEFKEQGLNTELYSKNKDRGDTYSIVPTSAISGEGIPEMLLLLVQWAQKTMIEKLTYNSDIQCAVLEVKVIEDLGTTIDVVLVNGVLHEGDEIVVCGFQGSIHTTIRSLLTPHLMKELRVKVRICLNLFGHFKFDNCFSNSLVLLSLYEFVCCLIRGAYIHHKEIKAAQGIDLLTSFHRPSLLLSHVEDFPNRLICGTLLMETQDGGDVKGEVSPRDIVYTQAAGGEEDPNIFHMLDLRFEGISWRDDSLALIYEDSYSDPCCGELLMGLMLLPREPDNSGNCEQIFLELMKVPRSEAKLIVYSYKLQFSTQVSELRDKLNIVYLSVEQISSSVKSRRVLLTTFSLGNAFN